MKIKEQDYQVDAQGRLIPKQPTAAMGLDPGMDVRLTYLRTDPEQNVIELFATSGYADAGESEPMLSLSERLFSDAQIPINEAVKVHTMGNSIIITGANDGIIAHLNDLYEKLMDCLEVMLLSGMARVDSEDDE